MNYTMEAKNLVIRIADSNMPTTITPVSYKKGQRNWLKYEVAFNGQTIIVEPNEKNEWVQLEGSSYELPAQDLKNIEITIKKNFQYVTSPSS